MPPGLPATNYQGLRSRLRSDNMSKTSSETVQIWVPDVTAPDFTEQARRQSLRVSRAPSEVEALNFIEAAADAIDKPA